MNLYLFISVLICMGVFYLIIGCFCSKGIEDNEGYFLAGRKLGIWRVSFTLIATQIGGGMLLGSADEAYNSGFYGFLYCAGMCLGFLLLGCGFASKLRKFNISTVPELFEKKYSSNTLKVFSSFLMVLSMAGILVGQVIASKKLLYALGIHSDAILIIFWLFIIAYTVVGGLKAVVLTDIYQVALILLVFTGIFIFGIYTQPTDILSISTIAKTQSSFITPNVNITALFLMPMMFSLIEQDLAQRFFAAKNARTATISSFVSSFVIIAFAFVPIYFGMLAKQINLDIPAGHSVLITLLQHINISMFVLVLAVCCILAAVVSTGDSLLCAISSNISQDFNFILPNIKNRLLISRWITLFIGAVSIVIAYFSNSIFNVLIKSYAIPVCCLFIPIIFCYFVNKPSRLAAIWSIVFGALGYVLFSTVIHLPIAYELSAVIFSLIGYIIGYIIDKNRKPHNQLSY
jgi:solute:Na+ symporter, SSS family